MLADSAAVMSSSLAISQFSAPPAERRASKLKFAARRFSHARFLFVQTLVCQRTRAPHFHLA
jgi:hypothetical protein